MADNPQPQPAPNPAPEPNAVPTPVPTPTPTPEPERTFSQADIDRIVQDRLARDRKDRPSEDEVAAWKDKATKFDELEAANQSDLEKAQAKIADLERQATDAAASAQEHRLRAAVVAEAAKKNVVDPDAALALLDRAALEFDGDGSPKNIAQAMDSLLEARPYLVASGGERGNADQGARGGSGVKQLTEADLKSMSPEAIDKAHKDGQLADYLGASKAS